MPGVCNSLGRESRRFWSRTLRCRTFRCTTLRWKTFRCTGVSLTRVSCENFPAYGRYILLNNSSHYIFTYNTQVLFSNKAGECRVLFFPFCCLFALFFTFSFLHTLASSVERTKTVKLFLTDVKDGNRHTTWNRFLCSWHSRGWGICREGVLERLREGIWSGPLTLLSMFRLCLTPPDSAISMTSTFKSSTGSKSANLNKPRCA